MNKLPTYDDKPFICLMKTGMAYYLTNDQYPIVAQSWNEKSMCTLENYFDPILGKTRNVDIDGYQVETVDQSEYVQLQHWLKQGGFVCKFKTFHIKNDVCDCRPKEDFSKQKDSGLSFGELSAQIKKEQFEGFVQAKQHRKEEIEMVYSNIEKKLREHGLEWCEANRYKWKQKAKHANAMIDWYALFQTNQKDRFANAIQFYRSEMKRKEDEAQLKLEAPKEDGLIPF